MRPAIIIGETSASIFTFSSLREFGPTSRPRRPLATSKWWVPTAQPKGRQVSGSTTLTEQHIQSCAGCPRNWPNGLATTTEQLWAFLRGRTRLGGRLASSTEQTCSWHKGHLRTFGAIQWESDLFNGRPKARCYPFDLPKHRFRGKTLLVNRILYRIRHHVLYHILYHFSTSYDIMYYITYYKVALTCFPPGLCLLDSTPALQPQPTRDLQHGLRL